MKQPIWTLENIVAVVTGTAPNGIGETFAKGLADAGATVVCIDVQAEGAEQVAASINESGGRALAIGLDITNEAAIERAIGEITGQVGGIDILINNAALMAQIVDRSTIESDSERWDWAFDVNVKGSFLMSKAVVPSMRERGGGAIVNMASAGAFPATSLYGITKIAVVGLTTTLATELAGDNIRVNAIAPGNTASAAGNSLTGSDEYRVAMKQMIPYMPYGEREDLIGTLLLLTTPAGRWITGQVHHVDGGWIQRP